MPMATRRRSPGEGTIVERSPGVWRLRAYVGKDPITGNPRQVSSTYRGNRTGALKALRGLTGEVDKGSHAGTNATMRVLLERWPDHLERIGRRPATVDSYRGIIRHHLVPAFGDVQVRKLTAWDLDRYYTAQVNKIAPGTIRLHHSILSGALSQAVKWGWRTTNPASSASPPGVTKTTRRAPSADEVRALIEACRDDIDLATAVTLAALTGARRGELCGLRWGDVDWEAAALSIERARVPTVGGDATGPTKSGEVRRVAVGPLGIVVLARYQVALDGRAGQLGKGRDLEGWLLSYDGGWTPMRTKGLTGAVTALGVKAGVPITLHELRHFAGTQMIGAGIDVRTAAGRLGHTPEMLLRVYSHLLPERDRAAADMLEARVLGKALASVVEVGSGE